MAEPRELVDKVRAVRSAPWWERGAFLRIRADGDDVRFRDILAMRRWPASSLGGGLHLRVAPQPSGKVDLLLGRTTEPGLPPLLRERR